METPVGGVGVLLEDYRGLLSDLAQEPSSLAALNRSYPKCLLLAAASSLEDRVKNLVPAVFERHGNAAMASFVRKRVMDRQYHTLFDWDNQNAKAFFKSFGDDCGNVYRERLDSGTIFRDCHEAFLSLGRERNRLVHNDYANFTIQWTPEEIAAKYKLALEFVDEMESIIVVGEG